jgi:hypothetical protein
MLVPETSVDKDNFLSTWERQIRLAGEVLGMKSISVSQSEETFPDDQFRLCILIPYSAHYAATGLC